MGYLSSYLSQKLPAFCQRPVARQKHLTLHRFAFSGPSHTSLLRFQARIPLYFSTVSGL